MLQRTFSPKLINDFLNHPSVYPYIQHIVLDKIDLSKEVENKNNVCLYGEHGAVLFFRQQFGIYEYHTAVLPQGRGQWAFTGAKHAFNYMFTKTEAYELITRCPDGNLASKALVRAIGMNKVFRTLPNFKFRGKFVSCDVMSLILQNWVATDPFIEDSGKWFHDYLEKEYTRIGRVIDIHDEDLVHNKYVGASVEMIRAGHIVKGIAFYNRFAYISGYEPISLISREPLVIDIRDAKLKILPDSFEVI